MSTCPLPDQADRLNFLPHSRARLIALAVVILMTMRVALPAATVTWTGAGGNNAWHNPTNWSGNALPGAADDVQIALAGASVEFSQGTNTIRSVTASRPLTISGGLLTVTNGFTLNSTTFTFSGGTLDATNLATLNNGSATLLGGQIAGELRLVNAGLHFGPSSTVTGLIRANGASSTLTGRVPPGVTVWVEGRSVGSSATLTVTTNSANAGLIRLETTSSTFISSLSVDPGVTLTNLGGALIQANLGTGGGRSINGTLANFGTVQVASNLTLTAQGRFEQRGGVVQADGELRLNNSEFEFRGGRLEGSVRAASTLIAVADTVTELSTLRAVGPSCVLASNASPAVTIWVEGRSSDSAATLTVTNHAVNRGTLRLETTSSTFISGLTIAPGSTLTNTITGLVLANPGTGGPRTLTGSVVNWGTLRVVTNLTLTASGRLEQRGGIIQGDGEVRLTGSTFDFHGGQLQGTVRADSTLIAVADSVTELSTLRVVGSGCHLASNGSPAVTIWVEGGFASTGELNVTNNTVNRGTLQLQTTTSTHVSAITVSPGNTLTNEASGLVLANPGTGGPRNLTGNVINWGTLRAASNSTLTASGSLEQRGGLIQGDGEFRFSSSTFDFQGGQLQGTVRADSTLIAVADSVTELSTLRVVGSGCHLASNGSPAVTIWVEGGFASTGELNVTNNTVNRGTLQLQTTTSTHVSAITVSPGNTLTNEASGLVLANPGTGGPRNLTGNVINWGTLHAASNSTLTASGRLEQRGGVIQGDGEVRLTGSTFDFQGGQLQGTIRADSTLIAVADSVSELSTLRAVGQNCHLASNGSPAVTIWVEGRAGDSTGTLNVTNHTVNRGIIRLESSFSTHASQMNVSAGVTLTNTGTGTIQANPGTGGPRTISGDLVNLGTIRATTNTSLAASGVLRQQAGLIQGDGEFRVSSGTFEFTGGRLEGTVRAAGFISVADSVTETSTLRAVGGSATLSSNASPVVTIWVEGRTGDSTATLNVTNHTVNRGTIRLETTVTTFASQMNVSPGVTLTNAPGASLQSFAGTGGARSITGNVQNEGTLEVGSGNSLTLATGPFLNALNGLVIGSGTISAASGVFTNHGTVAPGSSAGQLTFSGPYVQSASGRLDIELGGTNVSSGYDRFAVSGTATLNGTLQVRLIDGFVPAVSNTFRVLTFTSRTGDFATYSGLAAYTNLSLQPNYISTALDLLTFNDTNQVAEPPTIAKQPLNQTVINGQTANFSVTANGTAPFAYQWWFNSTNLPGATNSLLTLANAQTNQSGPYRVLVTNSAGSITSAVATLTVQPVADLVITDISNPTNAFAGQPLLLTWRSLNQGSQTATAPWTETVGISTNLNGSPLISLGSFQFNTSLGGGASLVRTQTVILPGGIDGIYYVVISTDTGNQVVELLNETNNTTVSPVAMTVRSPDLQPVSLAAPGAATYGDTLQVSWAVTNRGGAPVPAAWNDRIYLSTNAASLSGAATLATISQTNVPVAAGNIATNSALVTLPLAAEWTPGSRYLIVEADYGNGIAEVNETNNRFAAPITLALPPMPDFVVGGVSGPANLLPAQSASVNWITTNIGSAGVTSVWTETIFLATNSAGAGLIELGTFWFTNTLNSGAFLARTQSAAIPSGTPTGNLWFAVQTDSRNDVFEGNEANNLGVAASAALLPPVLTLQLSATQILEGTAQPIHATVTRNGSRAAPLSVTISNSQPDELSAPTNVTILAGQASAFFDVFALTDGVVDGPQLVTLTTLAPGFTNAVASVTVLDINQPTLTVTLVTNTVVEGLTLGAFVSRDAGTNQPLTVTVSSSNPGQLMAPAPVTISAGQFSNSFALLAVDDSLVELPGSYTVTVSASNHISGAAIVAVQDNDLPAVTLSFATTNVSENAGPQAVLGTVQRSPVPDAPLYLELESDTPGSLLVPALLTVPTSAGNTSFFAAAVDNALLDSNRTVVVRAYVKTSAAGVRVAQVASTVLTVTDNESPALSLTLAQSLVPEGASPATTATVTRNSSTNNALLVQLSSSLTNEAGVPVSVNIPAGSASAQFNITTPTDGVLDGSKQVTLTASAAGHNDATTVLTVTDVDRPDLVLASITAPATGDTESFVSLGYQLRNQGLAAMPSNTVAQRIYLSTDPVPGGDLLMGEFTFSGALPAGSQIGQAFSVRLPQAAGDYWVIVEADAGNAVEEILENNNTRVSIAPLQVVPAYNAVVSTTLDSGPANTPVPLTGSAFKPVSSAPVPFALVNIHIHVRGTHRVISALTDSGGSFVTTWQPLPGEAGLYDIGAAHPGYTNAPSQDSFSLFGMSALPVVPVVKLSGMGSVTGAVQILNAGDLALSGVSAQVLSPPGNLNFGLSLSRNALPGLATSTLTYTLNSTDGLAAQGTVVVRLTSAEGALLDVPFNISVKPLTPQLEVQPAQLVRGIKRGVQSFASFTVTNVGGAATGPINVSLPPVAWMALASVNPLPSLAPGEGITVALQLTPPADLPLGAFNGQLWLAAGSIVGVPFEFRALSDDKGALRLIATDEFTYYAAGAPKLTNAAVTLFDAVDGAVVTNGVTGPDGEWFIPQLPEGYYTVLATAEKHTTYQGAHLLAAGVTNDVTAFLSRQTVRYTWTVVPTEIEDRYQIVVETEFEANVPAPVVTITPSVIDLEDLEDEMQVDLVIENHGLIAAEDFELQFDEHPDVVFEPLVPYLGTLPAKSQFIVPLTIRRESSASLRAKHLVPATGNCSASGRAAHRFSCGGFDNIQSTPLTFPNAGICDPPIRLPQLGWIPVTSTGGPRPVYHCMDCGGPPPPGFTTFSYSGGGSGGSGFLNALLATIAESIPALAVPNPCDPECLPKLIPVLKDCVESLIPSKPYDDCKKGIADCAKTTSQTPGAGAAYACFKAGLSCSEAAGKSIPGPWKWLPVLDCAYGLLTACAGEESASARYLSRHDLSQFQFSGRYAGMLNALKTRVDRMEKMADSDGYFYGDHVWIESENQVAVGNFMEQFGFLIETSSDAGATVSSAELTSLLSFPRPPGAETNHVHHLVERWNRTQTYWGSNIFTLAQVPSGWSTDFLALDEWDTLATLASNAVAASEADGFSSLAAGLNAARDDIVAVLQADSGGVCARVKLRLNQEAVLSRDAFSATLEIDNNGGAPLEEIYVTLGVFDENGQDASALFGITAPEISGIAGTNGSGLLASNQTGRVSWTLVPAADAAPTELTRYYVSGGLNYVVESNSVSVPLSPAAITVHPSPRLDVKYFHQRDVFSDDPHTDVIEPSVPFSLAVMVQNHGLGTAKNFRITSAQPEIVENEKGLLIDFKIIATEVAGQNLTPSLTANLGDIGPGTNAIGRWLLTSTLQGLFVDYKASFEHVDSLGNPKLSLIESLGIHEMIRVVQAGGVFADGRPDFLVNDLPDVYDLPDTLHLSDGSSNAVQVVTNGNIGGTLSPGNLQVTLTAALPLGWAYLRVPDPGNSQYRLVGVTRSDAVVIPVDVNAWVTDRTFLGLGKKPVRENRLHLLDHDSTGSYTLTYEALPAPDTAAPTSIVAALPPNSRANILLNWSGQDNAGGSGLAFYDIYVSENSGPFSRWLANAVNTSAVFTGTFSNIYAFYSVAVDQAGNREAGPLAPDTQTIISLTNQPPVLAAITNRTLVEGQTLSLTASSSDPDGDALIFSLGAGAPAGMVLNSASGALFWTTGEAQGPSTNNVTLSVRDSAVPSLSVTQSFSVIVLETNAAPFLAAIADETVSEGQLLTFVVVASDTDIPAQQLAFSLGVGAPEGAAINPTNGVFTWTPASFQGGVTNVITVIVTDDGTPPRTASRSFAVTVFDSTPDFELRLATTALLTGASGNLGLTLNSGADLTNISAVIAISGNRLTNLTLQSLAPAVAAAEVQPLGSNRFDLRFRSQASSVLQGNFPLAQLAFDTISNAHSAVATLSGVSLTGRRSNGALLADGRIGGNRVFIVGLEPILDPFRTNQQLGLLLYAQPGETYALERRNALVSTNDWTFVAQFEPGTLVTQLAPQPATEALEFFRMSFTPPAPLQAAASPGLELRVASQAGGAVFQVTGTPGQSCVVEYTDHLAPAEWRKLEFLEIGPGGVAEFSPDPAAAIQRFYRVRPSDDPASRRQ